MSSTEWITSFMTHKRRCHGNCNYNHCAAIVSHSNGKILSMGINSQKELFQGSCYGTHAEMEAIQKFCRERSRYGKSRRRIKVDVFVIRISRSIAKLSESKPCRKCILFMGRKSNYLKIENVWYSTKDGTMICKKFSDLQSSIDDLHTTRRFRDDYDPTPWNK